MSAAPSALIVVAGLIEQNGTLLICQRHRDGAFPLKWEFPGGKVEVGETYEQSLQRELHEELGIQAQIGRMIYQTRHDYPDAFSVNLFFYQVVSYQGVVRNLMFEQICWAAPECLPTFDFLEGDAAFITQLSQGKLTRLQSQA